MKEHIKHASDGMFTVVAFFIGFIFLVFALGAFGSLFSSLFNIKDSATLLKVYFAIGIPVAIILGIIHSNKKHSK